MASSDEASHDGIMSGRTLNVASKIYSELQAMIRTHGDEVSKLQWINIEINGRMDLIHRLLKFPKFE